MPEIPENIKWSIRIPIFRNPIILKQLGIAIGIPFGLLILFLIIAKAFFALTVIAVLFLFTYLFILTVWGGKYDVGFELNKVRIRNFTLKNQANKNLIINTMTVVLGLFSGKPAVAGAGLLAQSRQHLTIKWSSIRKVKFHAANKTVMVKGGFAENIAMFCTSENYAAVVTFVRFKLQGRKVIFTEAGGWFSRNSMQKNRLPDET